MNMSEVFIRRPIATSLIMLGIGAFGVLAYRALPVSDLPNVDFPTLNVGAGLPGGDPGTMASAVASPLERQFTTIAGIDEMTSSSSTGSTNVTLQFDLNRDIDSAAVDVETAISAVMPLLPAGMPAPPSFRKFNPADSPVMFLGLTSDVVPMYVLDDYAETMIAPRISMVSGVSQVQVQGAQKYAVRVQVDPNKLHAEGIGINEVNQSLQNWNVNLPTGQLFGADATYNIQAGGQLMNADAFKPVVVAFRHGAPVRLDQVAKVLDNVEDNKNASWLYTKAGARRAINLQVMKQPGSNTIAVTDADPRAAAVVRGAAAAVGAPHRPRRSLDEHPRGVRRHPMDDAAHPAAGGRRDLRLPPQRIRHAHSGAGAAVLDPRHLRGDVDARLHARQPVDDGAHPLDRLRRRRCHRDAGEHRAPHRERRDAVRGGAERLEGNQLHDRVDDDFAGRRLHSRFSS